MARERAAAAGPAVLDKLSFKQVRPGGWSQGSTTICGHVCSALTGPAWVSPGLWHCHLHRVNSLTSFIPSAFSDGPWQHSHKLEIIRAGCSTASLGPTIWVCISGVLLGNVAWTGPCVQ